LAWSGLEAGADDLHDLGGAAEDRPDAGEAPELTIVTLSSGLVLLPVKADSIWSARAAALARCDVGGDHMNCSASTSCAQVPDFELV
jgi:hypothetical protein